MKGNTKQGKTYKLCSMSETQFTKAWERIPAGVVKKCTAKELAALIAAMPRGLDWSRLNFKRVIQENVGTMKVSVLALVMGWRK